MKSNYQERNGVTWFRVGETPGWGDLEFTLNGKPVEGVQMVDTRDGYGMIYARDMAGNWPVFDSVGEPVTYFAKGKWGVKEVYPPDEEFDDEQVKARREERRAKKAGA